MKGISILFLISMICLTHEQAGGITERDLPLDNIQILYESHSSNELDDTGRELFYIYFTLKKIELNTFVQNIFRGKMSAILKHDLATFDVSLLKFKDDGPQMEEFDYSMNLAHALPRDYKETTNSDEYQYCTKITLPVRKGEKVIFCARVNIQLSTRDFKTEAKIKSSVHLAPIDYIAKPTVLPIPTAFNVKNIYQS